MLKSITVAVIQPMKKRKTSAQKKWKSANAEHYLWMRTRNYARANDIEFYLKVEDVKIPSCCPVFGTELKSFGDRNNSPSIDRKDSATGYTRKNIIIVSYRAARMRSKATAQELRDLSDYYGGVL